MAWYSRQTNYPYHAYLAVFVLLLCAAIYAGWWFSRFSSEEARTLGAAHDLRDAIERYAFENGTYPAELSMVEFYLPKRRWPDNPYTGQQIVDTRDPAFDPRKSPGNVFYEREIAGAGLTGYESVAADTRQVGYVLHVFGADGEIWTYRGRTHLPVD